MEPNEKDPVGIMSAAFENRVGSFPGVGDGIRAAVEGLQHAGFEIVGGPRATSRSELRMLASTTGSCPICGRAIT